MHYKIVLFLFFNLLLVESNVSIYIRAVIPSKLTPSNGKVSDNNAKISEKNGVRTIIAKE